MHDLTQKQFKERGCEGIGKLIPSDYLIRKIKYIFEFASAQVTQEKNANNGSHGLNFAFSATSREHTTDLIGRIFHELEHGELDTQYEVEIDEYGEYTDINKDSISEIVCDLANLVNVNEGIIKDKKYFYRTAKRLGFEDAYKKVHQEKSSDGHYNSRAVLHNIFEEVKKFEGTLDLDKLLKELYYNSFLVIEEYRKQGKQNEIKFKDFIEKLALKTNDFLREKGFKIEITDCTNQFACFDSSSVPKICIRNISV